MPGRYFSARVISAIVEYADGFSSTIGPSERIAPSMTKAAASASISEGSGAGPHRGNRVGQNIGEPVRVFQQGFVGGDSAQQLVGNVARASLIGDDRAVLAAF